MLEEFHGINHGSESYTFQLLYGWNTLTANVWLPSLSELVGVTGSQSTDNGCYNAAMQGLNISTWASVDAKGGAQWTYFQPYNVSGGSQKIWSASNGHVTWLRSPDLGQSQHVTGVLAGGTPDTFILPTSSYAVHPAV